MNRFSGCMSVNPGGMGIAQRGIMANVFLSLLAGPANAIECADFYESTFSLPSQTEYASMDARAVDINSDNNIDVVVAIEYGVNIILKNDGKGQFSLYEHRLSPISRDSEDIAIADFDLDGYPDIFIVSEDDLVNEFYLNKGDAGVIDLSHTLPVTGISNAVVAADINNDSYPDVIIGNRGSNNVLINDGNGHFVDESETRFIPVNNETTQDLLLVDIDGDHDLDLVVANEGQNRVYVNNGQGIFRDETATRLPQYVNESREVTAADIDGDNDVDLYFSNVKFNLEQDPVDQILINLGDGVFQESVQDVFNNDKSSNFTADFIDLNHDGMPDILTGAAKIFSSEAGNIYYFLNKGNGEYLRPSDCDTIHKFYGNLFSIAVADFNNDGINDIYLANRISQQGTGGKDILLFGRKGHNSN